MDLSVPIVDRQVKASVGKHTQVGLPMLGAVSGPQVLDEFVVSRATFNGVLSEAARYSGLEDQQIADELHICAGYMSRFMRGVAQQWAKRLVAFMRCTNSLAPLQWMASQMGCDVVIRSSREARIRELENELQEMRRAA